jgi:uncharacterized membrane protein
MTATDLLFAGIGFIILALEGVAALLIVGGGVAAISVLVRGRDPAHARHAMSHMLLLALDFTIGADILKGVAAPPDLASVGVVAVVVLIRIVLTFALQRELRPQSEPVHGGG